MVKQVKESNQTRAGKSVERQRPHPTYSTQGTSREHIVPYAVLGLSLGALMLSVYAVTGGPVDKYLASRQPNPTVAYASEISENSSESKDSGSDLSDMDEILAKGEYDVSIKVDDDGNRKYVLTPIGSGSDADEAEAEAKDEVSKNEQPAQKAESDDANGLSEEAQKKLDEHKSMRLRIRPDRDGGDIYYYVVEEGDSLADISHAFNVPVGQLMEENYIDDGDVIYVGEVLFMPTDFVTE